MPHYHLLKFLGRHLVLLCDLLSRQSLNGRKTLALWGVANKKKDDQGSDQTGQGSHQEAIFPAQGTDYESCDDKGQELTYIRTGTEHAVVRTPFGLRKPARKADHSRRRAHRLSPAVHTPEHGKRNEDEHGRQSGWPLQKPEDSHEKVHQSGNQKTGGHETAHIAVVGDEAVHELAHRIDQQKCRSYESQFAGSQHSLVDERLFHHAQTHTADIIQTISNRRTPERPAAQRYVCLVHLVRFNLVGGRLAYSVERV